MNYRCIYISLLVLLAIAAPLMAQQSEGSKIIEQFQYPELEWSVPEVGTDVQRVELENGLILYLMEDHQLPLLYATGLIRCGEAYVPLEQMAIPGITGEVLRSGGTTSISADSLNALLELIGASLETSVGYDNGRANLSVLSQDTELGVSLLADVLRNPAFPEDKIELEKTELRTNIKRRNDNPQNVLRERFYSIVYGDHPQGRILEWEYVKPVTRGDLVEFHRQYFAPNNIMIGITGDFDSDAIVELFKKYFGDWARNEIDLPTIEPVADTYQPGVFVVRKDINQANLRFGHLGINRDNPDRYAVSLMNYILGGGSFTSRMTTKVRSDEGLAYTVRSVYQTDQPDRGAFYAYCFTKSETAHKAMRLMLDEVERIRQGEVTEEELASAKDSYINSYVFDFTSAREIVERLMELEYDDRPRDLLQNYIDNIRKVTRADILRVAEKYLRPDSMTFVVVGNPDKFDKPFDDFGPITVIELEEPVID